MSILWTWTCARRAGVPKFNPIQLNGHNSTKWIRATAHSNGIGHSKMDKREDRTLSK